jgi:hypothetical protein
MKNKYFIPDISDFHNGYEYERNDGGEWYSVTCDLYDARDIKTLLNKKVLDTFPEGKSPLDSDTYSVHYKATGIDRIRVPYLTKEQIEAEGWKYDLDQSDGAITFVKKVKGCYHELHFNSKKKEVLINYSSDSLPFKCKDINTLRKIIKLLGI